MRPFLIPFLSASILLLKSCDLNDAAGKRPEQIQHVAEQQLSAYFPKAKVIVSEEQRAILGITCVSNVGKPFLEQMVPVLEKSEGVKQLKEYRANYGGLEGLSRMLGMKLVTYRYFSLGFDQYVIRLDADTQQHTVIPAEQLQHYSEQYAQRCGNSTPPPANASTSDGQPTVSGAVGTPDTIYIWIGTFTAITHRAGEPLDEQSTIKEVLGLHTTQDFASWRTEEITDREQTIRRMLEQKHFEVKSLALRQIERTPMPQYLEGVDLQESGL